MWKDICEESLTSAQRIHDKRNVIITITKIKDSNTQKLK